VADRARGRTSPHPLAVSLAAQLDAFAAAVRGDDPGDLATADDGLAAMAVVDAARTSAAAGGAPVPVTDLREPTC
jgi:predicted dehydrogenase